MRVATDISGLDLGDYQKTVRLILKHPLITATFPDPQALPRVRRFAAALRRDLLEQFGYRLELRADTARLMRIRDELDSTRPARSASGRPFDRQRYAYLSLALSVLGRSGIQIALTELADAVSAEAARVPDLGLDPDKGTDRRAFVDAVIWLENRGVLGLAYGSAARWANDPTDEGALYNINRDAVLMTYRPSRVLQHLSTVAGLLDRPTGTSDNAQRRAAGQRARRALVEQPVVYLADVAVEVANHLRNPALAEDLERLTGLKVERRFEGSLLIDTASFSDAAFPSGGAIAQAALLLLGRIADRVEDLDATKLPELSRPNLAQRNAALVELVDSGMPVPAMRQEVADEPAAELDEVPPTYPFVAEAFLSSSMDSIMKQFSRAFGEQWRNDPQRLRAEATNLLAMLHFVQHVDGGVLVLPLTGRYRNVQAKFKKRQQPATLFDDLEGIGI